jgi:phage/plasmid-associated DNA primase
LREIIQGRPPHVTGADHAAPRRRTIISFRAAVTLSNHKVDLDVTIFSKLEL